MEYEIKIYHADIRKHEHMLYDYESMNAIHYIDFFKGHLPFNESFLSTFVHLCTHFPGKVDICYLL